MKLQSEPGPVLIGGEGRSGTTLLSVILDSHPELVVGPELHFRAPVNLGPYVLDLLRRGRELERPEEWEGFRREAQWYQAFHFINRCCRFGIGPDQLEQQILLSLAEVGTELAAFSDRCCLIERLGSLRAKEEGASRWGIKIMRDIRIAAWYLEEWPGGAFIHVIRDGRDVYASQQHLEAEWGYRDAAEGARRWTLLMEEVQNLAANGLPIYQVRYEDVVGAPKETLSDLVSWLNLGWDDALLTHHRVDHALFENLHDHPSGEAVRGPISNAAIGRYRKDLEEDMVAEFERLASSQLERWGYI